MLQNLKIMEKELKNKISDLNKLDSADKQEFIEILNKLDKVEQMLQYIINTIFEAVDEGAEEEDDDNRTFDDL